MPEKLGRPQLAPQAAELLPLPGREGTGRPVARIDPGLPDPGPHRTLGEAQLEAPS